MRIYQNSISQDRLRELLHYSPDTGLFRWVRDYRDKKAGQIAGCGCRDGYVKIAVDGGQYKAHCLAWFYVHGWFPKSRGMELDHRDTNRSNNKLDNLRLATKAQNSRNRKRNVDNKHPYKGIRLRRGKWSSQISRIESGKVVTKHLGTFSDAESAAMAYDKAALEMFGEFASTNFPIKGRPNTDLAPLG